MNTEEYVVEGYLEDKFGNRLCQDFSYTTQAKSFEEAERNAVYKIKTERLKLPRNFPAKLKQIDGIHFTHRKWRGV